MNLPQASGTIRWRIQMRSAPEMVYATLDSRQGRESFWAASAPEKDGFVHFTFLNGMSHHARVVDARPPHHYAIEYFGGSVATFELARDGQGGTDLTLTETGVPEANLQDNIPGWISVLLCLKAAVDFSIDLRNGDAGRTWDQGYVDV